MCMEKTDWEKCVDFHGHSCPGLAIGYRVSLAALDNLDEMRSGDEELVAIVENDACSVDAVMFLTGCTFGKGNFIYRDHGKQVYIFGSRNSNKALRLAVKDKVSEAQEGLDWEARINTILEMPENDLLEIKEIDMELPPRASLYNSVKCAECGETVMEARARVKEGKIVCIPCACK
ncbi:MAG: TraR/DksA C4-type zinc finger protein [Clostridiales bacterium]|nr:TraR/DksA C4-type zinc finger protein [Clostridiales bacterium]MCF8021501.1 TraR/DksA C4-type zinc finger protein [Clostridiales bacterium]